jgi:Cell Wall Hydrolase
LTAYDRAQRPKARPSRFDDEPAPGFGLARGASFVFAGMVLVGAVALAAHSVAENANARGLASENLKPISPIAASLTPAAPSAAIKGSLLAEPLLHDVDPIAPKGALVEAEADIVIASKGDFVTTMTLAPREDSITAMVRLPETPSLSKLEESFRLGREQKKAVLEKRRVRLAEQRCLATAIYFEARSESEEGQMAVARVILNRVKDPEYPKTVCGVVYEGANRRNSCQFSFACDGRADQPKTRHAWAKAQRVASRAMAGQNDIAIVSTATHYHADYVQPSWANAMKRLIKIGRHIFYVDG